MGALISSALTASLYSSTVMGLTTQPSQTSHADKVREEDQNVSLTQTWVNTYMNRSSRTVDDILAELEHNEFRYVEEVCIVDLDLAADCEGFFFDPSAESSFSSQSCKRKRLEFAEENEVRVYQIGSPCTAMNREEETVIDIGTFDMPILP